MEKGAPSAGSIILYPAFEALKADVDKLRTELSMLILERDALLYHECRDIETAYMLTVGWLEYKAYELECAILRLKRKVELIQAKKNRQEKVILSRIEETLDAEFAAYQAKLNEQIEKVNAALARSRLESLTEGESRALKKLYRSIVKALHPDLNPDLCEAKLQLFHRAVEAYERADLDGLRMIAAMVVEPALPDAESGAIMLVRQKEQLGKLLARVNRQIAKIKSEYPYTVKALVQSPQAIEARKAELEESIGQLTKLLAVYKAKIEEMLG